MKMIYNATKKSSSLIRCEREKKSPEVRADFISTDCKLLIISLWKKGYAKASKTNPQHSSDRIHIYLIMHNLRLKT